MEVEGERGGKKFWSPFFFEEFSRVRSRFEQVRVRFINAVLVIMTLRISPK